MAWWEKASSGGEVGDLDRQEDVDQPGADWLLGGVQILY